MKFYENLLLSGARKKENTKEDGFVNIIKKYTEI